MLYLYMVHACVQWNSIKERVILRLVATDMRI